MYRYKRGIGLDYDRQGYVYFTSRRFTELNPRQQGRIRELCRECGGENAGALFEFVTTDRSATAICMAHYISSKTTLYRAVKRYYETFPRSL